MESARLFVYGTLKRGFASASFLRDATFEGTISTASGFALHDLGPYPALVRAASGVVHGELFRVARELLAVLDRYEGVPELYLRELIGLADGDDALAYVMHPTGVAGHPRIEAGVWLGPRSAGGSANF